MVFGSLGPLPAFDPWTSSFSDRRVSSRFLTKDPLQVRLFSPVFAYLSPKINVFFALPPSLTADLTNAPFSESDAAFLALRSYVKGVKETPLPYFSAYGPEIFLP